MSIRNSVSASLALLRGRAFLGLDVSLACTGLAVVDASGRVVHASSASSVAPRTARCTVLSAGAAISSALSRVSAAHAVHAICVEDFLQTFQGGASSSHTRFTLARVNGVASYEAWRHTGAPVLFHYATSMRSYFRLPRTERGGGGDGAAGATGGLTPHAGLLVPAGDTTPAGARVLQRQRAAAKVAVKRGVLDYIVSLHGRRVMGGSGSVVETATLPTFSPLLMSDGTLGHDAFDRADAALAAMYCLAKEVEWATLAQTTAFWDLVDARLPTARAGRRARDAHTLPHLRRALETLHTQSLVEEAALRAVPTQADCTSNGDGGGGAEDVIPPLSKSGATPRKRRQAAASAAAADEGLPLDLTADALQRLYDRLRIAYTDAVREELAGPNALLPWRLADVSGDAGAATAPSGPLGSRSLRSRKKVG